MGIVIDLFFALEIVLNYNSAYIDIFGDVVDDRKMIFRTYFYGWFFIDLISILPLEIILLAVAESQQSDAEAGGDA